MTNFKDLLEHAAGDEPAITEDVLDADLSRGRRSVRRRRGLGAAAAAAGTAVAVAAAMLVAPGGPQAESGPAGMPVSPTATPERSVSLSPRITMPPEDRLPAAPAPARPVKLVPDGKVRPGTDLVCDLKPEGWRAVVWAGDRANPASELSFVHPTLHETGKYHRSTTQLRIRHARFFDEGGRKTVEKYGQSWEELSFMHRKAGDRVAIVSGSSMGPENESNGLRDFHMKMSETKLIQVRNSATPLGWDLPTALRFVGSCHYK